MELATIEWRDNAENMYGQDTLVTYVDNPFLLEGAAFSALSVAHEPWDQDYPLKTSLSLSTTCYILLI